MAADIEVKFDEITYKAVQKKLGDLKTKTPQVLKNAINATARQTRTDLAQKAQQTYVVKTNKFKSSIKIKSATQASLEAVLNVSGKANKLEDFQYKANTKRMAARAHVLRSTSVKALESSVGGKAFMAHFSSGHKAIAQRKGAGRLPLKGFYGPSPPTMVGGQRVYGKLEPDIYKTLAKNINNQIQRLLKS